MASADPRKARLLRLYVALLQRFGPPLRARRLLEPRRLAAGDEGALTEAIRPSGTYRLAGSGLGPETADAILLDAAGRPVFVADASTRRVLVRHRLLPRQAGHELARGFVEAHLPSDPALFNQFYALLVAVGKTHCRATPTCAGCPLRFDLRGRRPAAWPG